MAKTALVTGGSSGIGLSCAKALDKAGWRVYTLSRGEGPSGFAGHLRGDVTDPESCFHAVETVLEREEGLDLLVNCAGFGVSGAAEFTETRDARRQLEVNVLGTANMCQTVLGHMRGRESGRIINISSVAAVTPIPFQAWYSVSKAGINAYTMALANELRPFGVSVCAVMPGDTKTGFTGARRKSTLGDREYGGAISRSVEKMERDEQNGASPDEVGALVARLAGKKRVAPLYTVGFVYKCCVLLGRVLPPSLCNRILGAMYGG